jgi:hypothetical protein
VSHDLGLEAQARRRALWIAYAGAAGFVLMLNTTNALSIVVDRPDLAGFKPYVWEYSSGVVMILLLPAIRALLTWAPPGRSRWVRFVAAHLAGSVVFSFAHVLGMVGIRKAIYAALGSFYDRTDLLYEYRKDLVAYVGLGFILWAADQMAVLWARGQAVEAAGERRLYHLRDGARVLRVPADEIVAVSSARNYVEFHLKGGDKPLIRDTLSRVEEELSALGFLRTHRSWLVNPALVRAVTPAAAGDFRVELESGVTAPLSRRFPEALSRLRTPA